MSLETKGFREVHRVVHILRGATCFAVFSRLNFWFNTYLSTGSWQTDGINQPRSFQTKQRICIDYSAFYTKLKSLSVYASTVPWNRAPRVFLKLQSRCWFRLIPALYHALRTVCSVRTAMLDTCFIWNGLLFSGWRLKLKIIFNVSQLLIY